jgi:hypothetical protein
MVLSQFFSHCVDGITIIHINVQQIGCEAAHFAPKIIRQIPDAENSMV